MDRITLYHNLFLGCLIACIILAILAAVLFFVLDIRAVFGFLTGRSAKRQIRQMEEESAKSGRLFRKSRSNMQYVDEQMKQEMGISGVASPGARKVEKAVQSAKSAELSASGRGRPAPPDESREEGTALLQEGGDATDVLREGQEATSLLQNGAAHGDTTDQLEYPMKNGRQKKRRSTDGTFRIEREIIMIHAEEVI